MPGFRPAHCQPIAFLSVEDRRYAIVRVHVSFQDIIRTSLSNQPVSAKCLVGPYIQRYSPTVQVLCDGLDLVFAADIIQLPELGCP